MTSGTSPTRRRPALAILAVAVVVAVVSAAAGSFATALSGAVFSVAASTVEDLAKAAGLSDVETVRARHAAALKAERERAETLNAELGREKERVADLTKARSVRYRGETKLLRDAVQDTSRRIGTRVAAATARNVASMPMEALPLVGVEFIVGATAWELSDACALIEDVHELEVAVDPTAADDPERAEICAMQAPTRAELWEQVSSSPGAVLDEAGRQYGDVLTPRARAGYEALLLWLPEFLPPEEAAADEPRP